VTPRRAAIVVEADRLSESCEYASQQHFKVAVWWRRAHYCIGILATVLGAVATLAAFRHNPPIFSPEYLWIQPAATAAATVLTAVIAFLKPQNQGDAHHSKGVRLEALRARLRQLAAIEAPSDRADDDLAAELQKLSEERAQLSAEKPAAPSGLIFWLVRRDIERGRTSFRADQRP
jgi:hypothetical protein